MKENEPFVLLNEQGVNPLTSTNTDLVAAFATCGGELFGKGYECDELTEKGKDPKLSVKWALKSMNLEFPIPDSEGKSVMSTMQFIKRWNDNEWLKSNPNHPLTFIKFFVLTRSNYRDKIRALGSRIHMKRGDRELKMDRNLPDDQKRKFLELFNKKGKI